MHNSLFSFLFSLLNPIAYITNLILECLFFLVILAGAKLRLQIHLSKKYTILYFIKPDFYFEIHLPTEVVGILNSISFIMNEIFWVPCGTLESALGFRSGSSPIFKYSFIQKATAIPSAPIPIAMSNLLAQSYFQEHLKQITLLRIHPWTPFLPYTTQSFPLRVLLLPTTDG